MRWVGWVVSGLVVGGGAPRARAETYAVERGLDEEAALLALEERGALSPEEAETLRALLRSGVDVGTASRETLYALPGVTWAQVDALLAYRAGREEGLTGEALVEAGVLGEAQLRQLRPFLVETRRAPEVSGRLRLQSAYGATDARVPPVLLRAGLQGPWGLSAGLGATLTRRRLDRVAYDARRRVLVARLPEVSAALPKWHLRWTGARGEVLVGAFRVGFGQRLTLDTTGRPAPDGLVPDEDFSVPGAPERRCVLAGPGTCEAEAEQGRVTPDFGWTEGFRGVAGRVHGQAGGWTLSFTGFGSYQSRGLSQYELFDRARCGPSRSDCEALEVRALPPGARSVGPARFVSRTLPDVFHELAGGGHARVDLAPRAHLGLTAWRAEPTWALTGLVPDFRAQSRYPGGGGYGAAGLDAAWGLGPVDLFFEGAWSFTAAGGGFGAVQRGVLGTGARQLEGVLRYYGPDFENPHARPPASADLSGGLRASDEMGFSLRYLHRTRDEAWRWVGQVDFWTQPGGAAPRAVRFEGSARVEALDVPLVRPSVWVEHHDKDLRQDGPRPCFEGTDCAGSRQALGARVAFEPGEAVRLAAQWQWAGLDSRTQPEGRRREARARLEGLWRPVAPLRLEAQVAWHDEDLADDTRAATRSATGSVAWSSDAGWSVRARYEQSLDSPPRHLVRLELEGRL